MNSLRFIPSPCITVKRTLFFLLFLTGFSILSCDISDDDPELGTCRLYNNWNKETYQIINDITLEECQDRAANLPSNTTFWGAFEWTPN